MTMPRACTTPLSVYEASEPKEHSTTPPVRAGGFRHAFPRVIRPSIGAFRMSHIEHAHDIPAVLTVRQLAAFLHIGRNAAYEQCHRPGFPAIRIGKQLRIPRDALLNWLNAQANADSDRSTPFRPGA